MRFFIVCSDLGQGNIRSLRFNEMLVTIGGGAECVRIKKGADSVPREPTPKGKNRLVVNQNSRTDSISVIFNWPSTCFKTNKSVCLDVP